MSSRGRVIVVLRRQAGEPVHAGTTSSNSIWYYWTATNTVPVTFDTIGSTFDTLLAIYTGSSVGALTLTGSDRGSAGPGASRVMFNATNGITYRIAVDGATGSVGVAVLNWTDNAKPAITSQPASTNAYAGANVFFNVSVSGAAPFGYQWRYEGNPLTNNSYINGATSPQLTISKIITFDTGLYTVVITNSYGSITSAAANLIVINNPRVAYAENTDGPVGGTIAIPLRIQSLGDEHAINFSILFDTTKFTNPRLTNGSNSAGAILSPNSSLVGSGKFGGTVTLPLGQVLPAGNFEWAKILLDSPPPPGLTNGTVTAIGFGDQPVAKGATATNGAPLVAIFYAGNMTLYRNTAPTLTPIASTNINEGVLYAFTATANDTDVPAQTLTFTLSGQPAGATITTGGLFTWTPTEAQGPGVYNMSIIVADNGSPSMSATQNFTLTVNEVNTAPNLAALPIASTNLNAGSLLTFTANATDTDLPAQTLTFTLAGQPSGASITTGGLFTWTPAQNQAPGTNTIAVIVADNGLPSLTATQTFTVIVIPPPRNLTIARTNDTKVILTWTALAGRTYRVEYLETVDAPANAWAPAGGPLTATTDTLTYTDTIAPNAQRFYRVRLLP